MIGYLLVISLLFIVVLKLLAMFISERVLLNREELSPYECGFEHHTISRIPLSLRYFLLTLLFLLFDLEVIFLLFLPFSLFSSFSLVTLVSIIFLLFLYFGLIYEWSDGTLEWVF